jgi:hypothetical protein
MAHFNPAQPFPFREQKMRTYSEALEHSALVDAWLGLQIERVERELVEQGCRSRAPGSSGDHQQLWFGLATQSLLTPYNEIREILERIKPRPGETVVDLGAAYGRMGFVIARHFPGVGFVGYEYVGERVKESERCLERFIAGTAVRREVRLSEHVARVAPDTRGGHANRVTHTTRIRMEHADLSAPSFAPVVADYYFIYDYGTTKAIEKTLYDLRRIAADRPIMVIGRGRRCREAIEIRHPWLAKAYPGEAEGRATIYCSAAFAESFVTPA